MNLAFTTEQAEIAAAAERFLGKELPISRVRELAGAAGPALDEATWAECARNGWLALGLPESVGGLGLGARAEVMLFRELGRHLTPGPFRSTVLAAHAALAAGEDGLAADLAAGRRRAGVEVGRLTLDADPGDLVVRFEESEAGLRVQLAEVTDGRRTEGVDPGIRCTTTVVAVPVAVIADAAVVTRARLLVAAEVLGVLEAVRDMSAAYAAQRVQFDRPIGSFQAVKHRCADMAIAAYAALAQILFAAYAADDGHPDAAFHAAAAHLLAVSGARRAAADNIQNHGAIGFTMAHDAHLYLRRALTLEHLLGPRHRTNAAVLAPARHEFR